MHIDAKDEGFERRGSPHRRREADADANRGRRETAQPPRAARYQTPSATVRLGAKTPRWGAIFASDSSDMLCLLSVTEDMRDE
jgi:hypothetical protein